MNLYLSLLPFNRSQKSRIYRIDDYTYYNPSWHIYHRCGHLYIASDATAKNLRALDFAQEKIKNIAPYIHFPNPKSSIEGEMTRGLEQKTRIGTFYPYERESVAFYLNHLRVPSSRYVRLVRRFHDEWKSDGQCAPIVLQVSLPAAFYQSASGFTRWPLPALFSCR